MVVQLVASSSTSGCTLITGIQHTVRCSNLGHVTRYVGHVTRQLGRVERRRCVHVLMITFVVSRLHCTRQQQQRSVPVSNCNSYCTQQLTETSHHTHIHTAISLDITVQVQAPDLLNILRQSYDNAKVTIDLRQKQIKFTKHLKWNTSYEEHVQLTCKIGRSSEIVVVN